MTVVDFHPVESAAWRILFEDETRQIFADERRHAGSRKALHLSRDVEATLDCQQPHAVLDAHEPHGLARRAEPAFDFRTDRHPLDEAAERLGQKCVPLVPTVEAHLVAQQARGDADANRLPAGGIEEVR